MWGVMAYRGNEKRTKHGIVRVHTYFIEQHKHDTARVACTTTTTTTMMSMVMT